jgi:hypothetical protein
VEEMIDWIAGEVKTMSDTIWQLNDNFIILAIEGVLNMLNSEGCQELGRLHKLTASRDASILQDVHKLAGEGGGKHTVCRKLFVGLKQPMQ